MIRLHHLNQSRSKRIIWMLEELGIAYEIVSYQRNTETLFAPPELKRIHPLGKSPVIEDGDLVLSESGAIIEYLVERYGADRFAPPPGTAAHAHYLQWLHFAEGSAMLPLLLRLFVQLDGCKTNFMHDYAAQELGHILAYMDAELATRSYLVGEQFTGADVLNSFVLEMAAPGGGLEPYPHLRAYLELIRARPACIRADALEDEHDHAPRKYFT
ncbi:MAG: glutathione S-transferase family protein [Gammaproteobacteria bacterium]|nr:glutathione S-transferase family protein [Gammaproteobacteria bacterium]